MTRETGLADLTRAHADGAVDPGRSSREVEHPAVSAARTGHADNVTLTRRRTDTEGQEQS